MWSDHQKGRGLYYCKGIRRSVGHSISRNLGQECDERWTGFYDDGSWNQKQSGTSRTVRSNWSSQNRIHTSDSQTWTRMLLEILENEKLLQHQNHVSFILYMCFKNALRFHEIINNKYNNKMRHVAMPSSVFWKRNKNNSNPSPQLSLLLYSFPLY